MTICSLSLLPSMRLRQRAETSSASPAAHGAGRAVRRTFSAIRDCRADIGRARSLEMFRLGPSMTMVGVSSAQAMMWSQTRDHQGVVGCRSQLRRDLASTTLASGDERLESVDSSAERCLYNGALTVRGSCSSERRLLFGDLLDPFKTRVADRRRERCRGLFIAPSTNRIRGYHAPLGRGAPALSAHSCEVSNCTPSRG